MEYREPIIQDLECTIQLDATKEKVETLVVGKGYNVMVPNVFTPNSDTYNDTFKPLFSGFKSIQMTIYDYRGNLLYTEENSVDPSNPLSSISLTGWNGDTQIDSPYYIYSVYGTTLFGDIKVQKKWNIYNHKVMLRETKKILSIVMVIVLPLIVNGQEDYVVNQVKFLQKSNASFFGMNQLNRVGVLFNSLKLNESSMDNKYAFGSVAFQDNNFSLGFDVNSFKINDIGLTNSLVNLSYVYKIQISNYSYFLPALTLGLGSSSVNSDNLVFEDQLNMSTGFISTETIDPLAPLIANINYFDLGDHF